MTAMTPEDKKQFDAFVYLGCVVIAYHANRCGNGRVNCEDIMERAESDAQYLFETVSRVLRKVTP
jgi:predicted GNAT superfamily acetyltransferase